jgi:hypothetical protein
MKQLNDFWYHPIAGNFTAWIFAAGVISMSTYINGDFYGHFDGSGPMILGLFIGSLWTIRLHAFQEVQRIKKLKSGERLNHKLRFVIRFIVAYLIGLIVHLSGEGFTWQAFVMALAAAGYIGGIFWLLFDSTVNWDQGNPLLHIPYGYEGGSETDKFFKQHHIGWWIASKIIVFLVTLSLYHHSFQWFSNGN